MRNYDRIYNIDQEEVMQNFSYSFGKLYYKSNNKLAGCIDKNSGYRKISFKNKRYMEHSIIWIYFNGKIPEGYLIDHINCIRSDNNIENLRLANRSDSNAYRKFGKGYSYNKSSKKWQVRIKKDGIINYGGSYETEDQAKDKAVDLKKELHGDFSNHSIFNI
jgi:hypothetical protein